jgi:hypothetical protein
MGDATVTLDPLTRGLKTIGNRKMRTGTIAGSTSYATSGDAILVGSQKFGLSKVEKVLIFPKGGYTYEVNSQTAPTLLLAYVSGGTEVTATTPLNGVVAQFIVIGQ